MRSEQEVQKMIDAIKAGPQIGMSPMIKWAMISLLENVLRGPKYRGDCACTGPSGLCVCEARALAI